MDRAFFARIKNGITRDEFMVIVEECVEKGLNGEVSEEESLEMISAALMETENTNV